MTAIALYRPLLACCLVLSLVACRNNPAPRTAGAPSAVPPVPAPYEGETVVAIVEQLERSAHEEWLEPSGVVVSDLVAFGIFHPEHFDTLLFAHVKGHPRIDGRPLLLGDAVTFVLPRNWRNRDLALAELEGLAFAEAPNPQSIRGEGKQEWQLPTLRLVIDPDSNSSPVDAVGMAHPAWSTCGWTAICWAG